MLRLLYCACLILASAVGAFPQSSGQPSPWLRPEGSKALLQSLGLNLSEIKDGEPASKPPMEIYLRVLSRLRQLPIGVVHEWSKAAPEIDALLKNSDKHRGELYRLEGSLTSMEQVALSAEIAERFDVRTLYRLSITVNERPGGIGGVVGDEVEVWTAQVPMGLKTHKNAGLQGLSPANLDFPPGLNATNSADDPQGKIGDLDQVSASVKCDGVFLAIKKERDRKRPGDGFERPIFIATRLAWLPKAKHEGERLSESNLALSQAGFDISLLDAVRAETSKRLTPEVTEPFLQMLAAQPKVDLGAIEPQPLELAQLISHPESFIGEAIEFAAIARRVVEIPIQKEEDRKRLGIDRYFEIDLIVPKSVRTLVTGKDGVSREVVQANFPLTVCTTAPPQGLAIGEDLRQEVRASAFFFKLWAYESKFAQEHAADAMQVSPLFIAETAAIPAAPEISSASAIWVLGGAIGILVCLAVWGFVVLRTDDQRELSGRRESEAKPVLPTPAASHEPPST